MPNRIIKESIRTSYEIDSLSSQAEVTFYRHIVSMDTKTFRSFRMNYTIDQLIDKFEKENKSGATGPKTGALEKENG